MLKNHLKLAIRFFWKDKTSIVINVLGLAIGLASCMVLMLWVNKQFGYNDFLPESERVYQMITNIKVNNEIQSHRATSAPVIQEIQNQVSGIEAVAFMRGWEEEDIISLDNVQKYPQAGRLLSTNFFSVIKRPFLFGDPGTALDDPLAVVISASLAAKLFGENWRSDIHDQTVLVNEWKELDVTGVFEDFPSNATIRMDYGLPLKLTDNENVGNFNYDVYLKLQDQVDPQQVGQQIDAVISNKKLDGSSLLQAFGDTYLYSNIQSDKVAGGRIEYVRLFIIVSLFILVMACINFTNLYMASASRRNAEIGIKKILGARPSLLVTQLILESIALTLMAGLLAIMLLLIAMPYINHLLEDQLSIPLASPLFWLLFLSGIMLTGLVAGIYPAIVIAAFNPLNILKANQSFNFSGVLVRKGLFTIQFFISLLLIFFTFGVKDQLSFLKNKDLGYDKTNIIYKKLSQNELQKMEVFRQRLLANTAFKNVTFASTDLQKGTPMVGDVSWPGKAPDNHTMFSIVTTDPDFLQTLTIPLYAGRGFPEECSAEQVVFVINRLAAGIMGGNENILDQQVTVWDVPGQVVGIVENFHFTSLFSPIEPLIIACWPDQSEYLLARVNSSDFQQAITVLQDIQQEYDPDVLFEYTVLQEALDQQYHDENNIDRLSSAFSGLSVLISWLGLFGLANFTLQRRAKELSIRKLMGGSFSALFTLVARDFMILIAIAFAAALPVAWYLLSRWMNKFEYADSMSVFTLLIPAFFLIGISLLAILYHAVKVIVVSPSKTLRID